MLTSIHVKSVVHLAAILLHPVLKYVANAGQPQWLEVIPRMIRFVDYVLFSSSASETHWGLFFFYCLVAMALFLSVNSLYILIIWNKKQNRTSKLVNRSLHRLHSGSYPRPRSDNLGQPESRAEVVIDAFWVSSLRLHDVFAYGLMFYVTGIQFVIFMLFTKAVHVKNFGLICLTIGSALLLQTFESPSEIRLKACVASGFCQYRSPMEENYVLVWQYIQTMMKLWRA